MMDPATFQLVIGDIVLDENGIEKKEHKYVFAPEGRKKEDTLLHITIKTQFFSVVQKRVDKTSNIAKLIPLNMVLLSPETARDQFSRVLSALPCGASEWPCKLLASGKNNLFKNRLEIFNFQDS